jgi:hypothetical protein
MKNSENGVLWVLHTHSTPFFAKFSPLLTALFRQERGRG